MRAGFCAEPAQCRWSSYRATLGLEPPGFLASDNLLALFGETRQEARKRYRNFVEDRPQDELGLQRPFLGSEKFAAERTRDLEPLLEVPRSHWQPVRPPLGELLSARGHGSIAQAYSQYGYTMREIAEHLGVHYATVSRRLRRHEEAVLECKT